MLENSKRDVSRISLC